MEYIADGGVTSPRGYRASGVHCGLKKENRDFAAVVSDVTAAAAGVYTRNLVKGHSLQLTMERMRKGRSRALLVNSGCANACVGPDGYADAVRITEEFAAQANLSADEVMIGSTGVIGQRLPYKKLAYGISKLLPQLSYDGGSLAADAIMTTDTVRKECAVRFEIDGTVVTVGGMAKGSGMIHPNMGTMISLITTDACIAPALLQEILSETADKTYNRVSVDGDTSVCDMCLAFANGLSGLPEIRDGRPLALFREAFGAVAEYLARLLAKDGEGATKLLEIRVQHARTQEDAYKIASAIARSPLCKTMFFGEDANCGRLITAAGYSGASFDPEKTDIFLGDLPVYRDGTVLPFDEDAALSVLRGNEVTVTLDLKDGACQDRMWTCDFSYDYVKINGSYRS